MAAERSPILSEVRATLGIAAPLAAANLAQMAMGITNTIMVGELGAAPLAAAGLGGMLFYMMAMLCQGVLSAVAPLAAHAIGADDHPTAGRVAGAGLIVAAALALPIVAILTAIPSLLALLGYEPALATEIGNYLRMIRWGAPAFLGFAVFRFLLGLMGSDALGAHQLVLNVASLTFMVPLGLSQAATVRVAYQLGLGVPAAARRAAYIAVALGAAFMSMTAVLLLTLPRTIASAYVALDDPANAALLAIAVQLFVIAAVFQIFDGVQVIAVGALRGYRDAAVPMLIAAIGYWGIGFVGSWLFAFPLGFGPIGLWLGLALGLAVVATSLIVRLRVRARTQMRAVPVPLLAAKELPA